MLRRLFLVLTLALLFCLGQQGAAVHALSHYAEAQGESQQDKSAPHAGFCDQCLAHAALDAAMASSTHAFALPAATAAIPAETFAVQATRHFSFYASRAPPVFA